MQPQEVSGGDALLRAPEVYTRLGISRREFYRRIERGKFPPGVKVGDWLRRWPKSVVDAWIADNVTNAGNPKP
jgi:prophage regulatory protein